MAELVIDIKPRGIESAYINAPFDEAKKALEKAGYRIISLQENAGLRIQERKDAFVSKNGNFVKEGVLYVPQKGIFLARNSPIMENAVQATECHRNGKEFCLKPEQVEKSLADSVELKAEAIPTTRFSENPITVYAFGEYAQRYGEFLKEARINKMPVYCLALIADKAFARQLWFCGLGYWSGLDGDGGLLGYSRRVRGVKDSAEGTSKNLEQKLK